MIHPSVKMLKLLLVLCLLSFLDDSSSRKLHKQNHNKHLKHDKKNNKIVGGTEAEISEYPYQVALLISKDNKTGLCGGSILNEKWVLTAAHCLDRIQSVNVRAGSTHAESGGQLYTPKKFTIHPGYNKYTLDYDIAIVSLDENSISIDNKTTARVKLPSESDTVADGTNMTITGYGTTSEGGKISEHLLKSNVNIVNKNQCQKTYSFLLELSPRQLCAGTSEGGKDTCQGDSGGPLVETSTKVQYGIVSFGLGCGRRNVPGIYTFVPKIRQWIREQTGV